MSSGLMVAEVVTRGSAAADQYVELYNASQAAADLDGLELIYVTASGSTVTRKQAWSAGALASGAHLLVANLNGRFAGDADGVFSGGFSTTGGTLALREIGGQVLDSLSWGSAISSFVEGLPGGAPPTGSSLERRPGASAGNWLDTNDNSADAFVNSAPVAEGLAAPPVAPPTSAPSPSETGSPAPTPTASPWPTDSPPACATPSASPTATPTPSSTDTPAASVAPSPTSSAVPPPTPSPAPSPTPSAPPSPTPSEAPTEVPTPMPTPQAITIGAARGTPLGANVSVIGRLTTPLGLIDEGRGAFIESGGAGIAIRLVAGSWPPVAPGTDLLVSGTLADHAGQLTLEIAGPTDVATVGSGPMPAPYLVATGLICEPFEGRLLAVEGLIGADPTQEPDGLRTTIDDGSGPVDVVAPLGSFVEASELRAGTRVTLAGVIGQHDLTGLGISGYRLILRSPDDLRPVVATPRESALDSQALLSLVLVAAVLAAFAARPLLAVWRRRA
ncbi:MAG: hypothetical protein ABI452_02465 [Candidatus Limnocylindrales bacterium]